MKNYLIIIFLFFIVVTQSQSLQVSGKIIDDASGEPLPYASVVLKGTSSGTVSNLQGKFIFKFPAQTKQGTFTVVVSYIGYQAQHLAISQSKENIVIRLQEQATELNTVTVSEEQILPEDYIKKILEKKEETAHSNFSGVGFYREEFLDNDSVAFIGEMVAHFNQTLYKNTNPTDFELIKGREIHTDYESFTFEKLPFKSQYESLMGEDPFGSSGNFHGMPQSNFMKERHFEYYSYQFGKEVIDGQDTLLVINFEPKPAYKNTKKAVYEGSIYFTNHFQIRKIVYKNVGKMLHSAMDRAMLKILGYNSFEYDKADVSAEYGIYQGKTYLKRIIADYQFKLLRVKTQDTRKINARLIFIANEIEVDRPRKIDSWNKMDEETLLRKVVGTPDEDFWEEYNFLYPENKGIVGIQR